MRGVRIGGAGSVVWLRRARRGMMPPEATIEHPVNIGPKERAKRQRVGYVMLAVAVGAGVWMQLAEMPAWWRVFLLAPLFIGWLGVLQAAGKT